MAAETFECRQPVVVVRVGFIYSHLFLAGRMSAGKVLEDRRHVVDRAVGTRCPILEGDLCLLTGDVLSEFDTAREDTIEHRDTRAKRHRGSDLPESSLANRDRASPDMVGV